MKCHLFICDANVCETNVKLSRQIKSAQEYQVGLVEVSDADMASTDLHMGLNRYCQELEPGTHTKRDNPQAGRGGVDRRNSPADRAAKRWCEKSPGPDLLIRLCRLLDARGRQALDIVSDGHHVLAIGHS